MIDEKESDIKLVEKAKNGDLMAQEALIVRYAWVARSKARKYFIDGGTCEDLAQEGMIGIWKAIGDFDPSKNDSFGAFVSMCVSSQIKDTLKSYNRNKHKVLNEAVSLTALDDNVAPEYVVDPVSTYIEKEGMESFYEKLNSICNETQMKVLRFYLEGYSYSEIAALTDFSVKKVDNTLLAVKSKIKKNKELFLQ